MNATNEVKAPSIERQLLSSGDLVRTAEEPVQLGSKEASVRFLGLIAGGLGGTPRIGEHARFSVSVFLETGFEIWGSGLGVLRSPY